MRVIIPAAGIGNRLRPITDDQPKCMINLNGRPLIYWLLEPLKQFGVKELVLVVGHRGDLIETYLSSQHELPPYKIIYNDRFADTNSIVSISLTREFWDEDFCIIDSDLLVRPKLLDLLFDQGGSYLIIDDKKHYDEIDMKVKVKSNRFITMAKDLSIDDTAGEFFGLSKWDPTTAGILSQAIDNFLKLGNTEIWYEWAIREIAQVVNLPVRSCESRMWFEIDNERDYEMAMRLMEDWKGDWK